MLHSAVNNRSGALQHLLLRYTLALLNQMAQTAVCNRQYGGPATLSLAAAQSRPVVVKGRNPSSAG